MNPPSHARVVICGGGIAGASVAYHLPKFGINDAVLLERHQLTSGTTWHAAGLIMQLRSTHQLTELARYNVELYAGLEKETGIATGFKQNGTLGICRTKDRLFESQKLASQAKCFDIEAYVISPTEAKGLYPPLDTTHLEGAIFIPKDGQTNPVDTTMSLIAGARHKGIKIIEHIEVLCLEVLPSREYLVHTQHGSVQCEVLLLACGLWTRKLASQLGISVPLYPCEHYYIVTEPLEFLTPNLPVLRDTDGYNYVKEDAGRLLVGAFEPTGKSIDFDQIPKDIPFIELPEDWDQFELPYLKATEVLPDLKHAGIARFLSGPESFTPDLMFSLGEVLTLPNCYISAGYNSEGIELNPGAGRYLAEWIAKGKPLIDLSESRLDRFHHFQNNTKYLCERSSEVLGLHYRNHWPHRQKLSSRNVRKSVLHDRWADLNASFGESLGWERPMWFAGKNLSNENVYSHTYPNWFEFTAQECKAARSSVVIFDQSSFGKLLVHGKDACNYLQWLCCRNVDVPIGRVVYTFMLNDKGGIEVDATVNRIDKDKFLVVTSAASQPRDISWIMSNLPEDKYVCLSDLTSNYTVLSIQGPSSRDLLAGLTSADLSDDAFPYSTSQVIELGYGHAICNRMSFVGELGWELFIATEFAQNITDQILMHGKRFALNPAGYHALEHLRIESANREFDHELSCEDTPYEAGLGFTVNLNKSIDFLGQKSLVSQSPASLKKRLVNFKLHNSTPVLFGQEPIVLNDKIVGYLSSGAYSFNLECSLGMGYVHHEDGVTGALLDGESWAVEVAGCRFSATASFKNFLNSQ